MFRWFKLKTFILFLLIFSVWGLVAQSEGCNNLANQEMFRLTRGNEILIPVSAYTSGRTCNDPLLYLLNTPYHIFLSLLGAYLVNMDEKERKKRSQQTKNREAIHTRFATDKLRLIIAPATFLITVVLYFLFRNNFTDYGYLVILGSMIVSLVIALMIVIPNRNNPEYPTYYFFHPTKFVKLCVAFGILFAIILYIVGQCSASYGLSLGIRCFSNLLTNPSSFFGN